ncbi:MAG TPA: hypothetical protein DEX20_07785, partial [Halieaceae bacterium]|nr:hypothetical protein [Halieaceae bacterium]
MFGLMASQWSQSSCRLETKLQDAFNLPATQAAVLVNGKSHRIKRSCSADEAQKLSDQFTSWGAKVRIEAIEHAVVSSTSDEIASPNPASSTSSLSLAAAGETIPTRPRDMTPP